MPRTQGEALIATIAGGRETASTDASVRVFTFGFISCSWDDQRNASAETLGRLVLHSGSPAEPASQRDPHPP